MKIRSIIEWSVCAAAVIAFILFAVTIGEAIFLIRYSV